MPPGTMPPSSSGNTLGRMRGDTTPLTTPMRTSTTRLAMRITTTARRRMDSPLLPWRAYKSVVAVLDTMPPKKPSSGAPNCWPTMRSAT